MSDVPWWPRPRILPDALFCRWPSFSKGPHDSLWQFQFQLEAWILSSRKEKMDNDFKNFYAFKVISEKLNTLIAYFPLIRIKLHNYCNRVWLPLPIWSKLIRKLRGSLLCLWWEFQTTEASAHTGEPSHWPYCLTTIKTWNQSSFTAFHSQTFLDLIISYFFFCPKSLSMWVIIFLCTLGVCI